MLLSNRVVLGLRHLFRHRAAVLRGYVEETRVSRRQKLDLDGCSLGHGRPASNKRSRGRPNEAHGKSGAKLQIAPEKSSAFRVKKQATQGKHHVECEETRDCPGESVISGDVDGSPDGLWFSQKTGVLYIQTDDGAFTDTTNCMLVAAVPGEVGDGSEVDVDNTAGGAGTVRTKVGAVGTLRRLLVGPIESEITGLTESGDGKALFINIQHPGEDGSNAAPTSSWPYPLTGGGFGNPAAGVMPNAGNRPRSATIVLTRIDGGLIGQ